MIYLDSAATTLIKPGDVATAAEWAVRNLSSPGRGGYSSTMRAADIVFECREKVSSIFGVENPENIIFTMNATHGLNIAVKSLASAGSRVVVSGYEHNAVMRPLHAIGADVTIVRSPLFDPVRELELMEAAITENVSLVVINHVSNVFGYIQPVAEVAKICKMRGVPLVIDASQSAGSIKFSASSLGAEYIAMPGHKGLYGPQGSGILICNAKPRTLIEGGTGSASMLPDMPDFLPDRLEAGTHNMPGIYGLSKGLDYISRRGIDNIMMRERRLIRYAASGLNAINGIRTFASRDDRLQAGVLSFTADWMDSEDMASHLGEREIAVRSGLHCAPQAHITAGTDVTGTVRVSVSDFSTKSDIDGLLNAVDAIHEKI